VDTRGTQSCTRFNYTAYSPQHLFTDECTLIFPGQTNAHLSPLLPILLLLINELPATHTARIISIVTDSSFLHCTPLMLSRHALCKCVSFSLKSISDNHRHRSSVNFGGQDIFARKYMYEKLTICPNFTWYLPEKYYFPIFLGGRVCGWGWGQMPPAPVSCAHADNNTDIYAVGLCCSMESMPVHHV